MSTIDNIFIQVRARLQAQQIKLWLEPYYFDDVGSIENEIDLLAAEFSRELGITESKCKCAITELQDAALRKLAARKEFEQTGHATFSVRRIDSREGTQTILEIKCSLTDLGAELQTQIAAKLNIDDLQPEQVKCISAGKIIVPNKSLVDQGLRNNQQLMVIIGRVDESANNTARMYDRISKIKMDVEAIVDSERNLFEMEDQDGNPVFLPPDENRALLIAMGFCEKAHAAMKREQFDEALILLLEADNKFNSCNSKFLEAVDNYALVNLDIVWCYLCLKNVSQLPDAERRLAICEQNFRRSYGENFNRLIALKGNACPERALIMRLHLLQGVVLFHQNRRDEAYERFELATTELRELKVNEDQLMLLIDMGYTATDARLGLRSCGGNMDQAINFIHERRDKIQAARSKSQNERNVNQKLTQLNDNERDWVNPRSVCSLMEMGYDLDLVVEALKRCDNNVARALDLIQTKADELRQNLTPTQSADDNFLTQLRQLGFEEQHARIALETTENDMEKAIDFLLKLFGSEDELMQSIQQIITAQREQQQSHEQQQSSDNLPSTSRGLSATLFDQVLKKAHAELESYKAYKRFNEDITGDEQDYLDLTLTHEEQILIEYKRLLE